MASKAAKSKSPGIADLRPASYNPRSISPESFAALKHSLSTFGDISGLTWNSRSGNLVSGHQRLRALQDKHGQALKMKAGAIVTPDGEQFPVRIVDWPESKEKLANIAANNPLTQGEFTDGLDALIGELQQSDVSEILSPLRVDELLSEDKQPPESPNAESIYEVAVTCRNETEQERLCSRLIADGYDPHVITMPLNPPVDDEVPGEKPPAVAPNGSVKITLESPIVESFRVSQVRGMFDVPNQKSIRHEWNVLLPINKDDWQIGLIVGPSGSGKTTIARRIFKGAHFHEGYKWPTEAALIDGFPKELSSESITAALSSVGFSSPPHWLKRHEHLSNGQKFRCELARLMLEKQHTVIFDEFTSVVDRDAAKVSSAAVAKALRRRKSPRLIACSCHYDVIDWLDPDWVYNTATGEFARRALRRRPPIQLEIHHATSAAWPIFAGHHYLTRSLNKSAKCFVATWNGTPVAFTSCLPLVHAKMKGVRREHRTVVLPDFQGVGIGNALSEWLGKHLMATSLRFRSTTSHPAMIRHRLRSPIWRLERLGRVGAIGRSGSKSLSQTTSTARVTAAFEYVGGQREENLESQTIAGARDMGSVKQSKSPPPSTTDSDPAYSRRKPARRQSERSRPSSARNPRR